MAYDAARQRTVLFGGFYAPSDTWEWDGATWTQRSPAGGIPFAFHAMAYHGGTERVVAVDEYRGGTWEYYATHPASYEPFGVGCGVVAGVPALAAAPFSRPWVAEVFEVELTNVPPGASAWLLLGGSKTSWLGVPLPFSLVGVGMPGCNLYTSVELQISGTAGGGTATWALPITGALGASFYHQAAVLDPTANPLGMGMSNAATAIVGAR